MSSLPSSSESVVGPRPPAASEHPPNINLAISSSGGAGGGQHPEGLSASWSGLRASVRESRRALGGSLSALVRTPSQFVFRRLGGVLRTRVYFLSSASSRESTLLYVDVDDSSPSTACDSQLTWNSLIESMPSAGKMTKEEQLMSERKRCVAMGITDFECHPPSGKFVFPAAASLFACVDYGTQCSAISGGQTSGGSPPGAASSSSSAPSTSAPLPSNCVQTGGALFPFELKTRCRLARLNPAICPSNPDLVAFVGDFDLWLTHLLTGQELRLTHSHKGKETLADDPVSTGLPSYVMQEEFNRFTGVWWRPRREGGRYSLLYEEVDESSVELLHFPSSATGTGEVDEFRFPRAGAPNARSKLKLVEFSLDESSMQVADIVKKELPLPLEHFFPWLEYIVRVGWTPDGRFIWCQLLDRRQHRLELVLISPKSFYPVPSSESSPMSNGGFVPPSPSPPPPFQQQQQPPPAGPVRFQVVASVNSFNWVSVNDTLTFLRSEDPSEVRFVWSSEESGFRHLCLVTSNISGLVDDPAAVSEDPVAEVEGLVHPKVIQKVALTSGDWPVCEDCIWVDETHDLVYFAGYRDTPLEKHLYVTSLLHSGGEVRRLTALGYSNTTIEMSNDCSMFVTVYSSIQNLPASRILRVGHKDSTVEGIVLTPAGWIVEPRQLDSDYKGPELFSNTIQSGDKLYAMIFKPNRMEPGKKYPVVLNVYGGPEVQLVSNTFKGCRQIRNHLLASLGYCVVCIDSRGSQNRGTAFESHLRLRMGQVEMGDQVEMLQWLSSVTGYLDMERVAVHGWSYGGYLSLMAIVQFPKIFKLAIAGAPVVSWKNYDTGYTERYMDLPSLNQEGYAKGNVLSHAAEFPDEPNRLLIVHGLMDENVHFYHHTSTLITQLIKHGKPYQLQVYPGERHSLRHFEASEHYETTLLSFLKMHL